MSELKRGLGCSARLSISVVLTALAASAMVGCAEAGGGVDLHAAVTGPVHVTYTGSRGRVVSRLKLRASASSTSARIVAVTYRLDGKPFVSSTVPPYTRELDPALIPQGEHRISVEAIDALGRRARTAPISITLVGKRRKVDPRMFVVTPKRGLHRALRALARGHVTVRFAPGRYVLQNVSLGNGVTLLGAGNETVLAGEGAYEAVLIARGRNIVVSDLAIDGGGPGSGIGDEIEVASDASNVLVRRVTMMHVRHDGLFAWGRYAEVSIQDSTLTGDGSGEAGVVAGESGSLGESRDSSVIRTRITGFRDWGILFAHQAYGTPDGAARALALDDTVSWISGAIDKSPGTAEGGIWSGSASGAIIGNTVAHTGWDGIETVGSSDQVTVVKNTVRATKTGIYLEHSTNSSLIADNDVAGVETGIVVEWKYGGFGSDGNTFARNRISGATHHGLVIGVQDDGNHVVENTFVGDSGPMIVLQGSSGNLVQGNLSCLSSGPFVAQWTAAADTGTDVTPQENVISDNRHRRACGQSTK